MTVGIDCNGIQSKLRIQRLLLVRIIALANVMQNMLQVNGTMAECWSCENNPKLAARRWSLVVNYWICSFGLDVLLVMVVEGQRHGCGKR